MHTEQWAIATELSALRTLVSEARDGIHRHIDAVETGTHRRFDYQDRRLDQQDRQDREWRKYMLRKLDKPRNGSSRIPYGKLCAIGILLLIGIASKAYPEATKKASLELVERLLLGAVRN